jgi:hypothetical protein
MLQQVAARLPVLLQRATILTPPVLLPPFTLNHVVLAYLVAGATGLKRRWSRLPGQAWRACSAAGGRLRQNWKITQQEGLPHTLCDSTLTG